MTIKILAAQEHLRLGYEAVLEMKGFKVTDENPDCVVVDMGDDLEGVALKLKKFRILDIVVFIVSPSWSGKAPQAADRVAVLRGPVTAEALLNAVRPPVIFC